MKLRASTSRAPFAHDLDAEIAKIFAGFRHFTDALDLPGNLIDVVLGTKVPGVVTGVLALAKFRLVEQGKRVMVTGVPAKVTRARRLSDKKPEQIKVKMPTCFQIRRIEAEVTQPPYLERAVQRNAADVVFFRYGHSECSCPFSV